MKYYKVALILGAGLAHSAALAAQVAYRPLPAEPAPPPLPPKPRQIELGALVNGEQLAFATRTPPPRRDDPAPVVPGFPRPAPPAEYATAAQGPNRRQRRWRARMQQKR